METKGMSSNLKLDKVPLLSRSAETETAKTLTDETLISELALRGYEIKNTQKKNSTAEIVKIAG